MAKHTRFAPHYDPRSRRWVLNIPSQFSETGKRQRLFYQDKDAALNAALSLRERRDQFGVSLSNLSPVRLGQASECFELLDAQKCPTPLIAIVRQYLSQEQRKDTSKGILDVFNAYLESKPHLSRIHREQIGIIRDKFKNTSTSIASIASQDLESMLSPLSAGTRNRYLRILKAVFNYALKKEWIQSNPVLKLDFTTLPKRTVEIFTSKRNR